MRTTPIKLEDMPAVIAALSEPFPLSELEFRIGSTGKTARGIWASVYTYVTNRAIMRRLDDVVGPTNWQNHLESVKDGFLCSISIKVDGEWLSKSDGANCTGIEPVKGGISDSMKRAVVQWGIGRYLYDLPSTYAKISDGGKRKAKTKDGEQFKWDAPDLPPAFLPKVERKPVSTKPPVRKAEQERPVEPTELTMAEQAETKGNPAHKDYDPHFNIYGKRIDLMEKTLTGLGGSIDAFEVKLKVSRCHWNDPEITEIKAWCQMKIKEAKENG